jgi:hypothetical protein
MVFAEVARAAQVGSHRPVVSTIRKRAFAAIIFSYASAARSKSRQLTCDGALLALQAATLTLSS